MNQNKVEQRLKRIRIELEQRLNRIRIEFVMELEQRLKELIQILKNIRVELNRIRTKIRIGIRIRITYGVSRRDRIWPFCSGSRWYCGVARFNFNLIL